MVGADAGASPAALAVADLDGDERADVVVGYAGFEETPPSLFLFFQGDGQTFTAVQIGEALDLVGIAAIAIVDLNDDGRPDIVVAYQGRIALFINSETPRTGAAWGGFVVAPSIGDGIGQWTDIAVGDIDGINGPDIVACGRQEQRLSWFRSPATDVADGTDWLRYDIDTVNRSGAAAVLLEDIDVDGRMDIYSSASLEDSSRVVWYRNPLDPIGQAWDRFTIGNLPNAARLARGDLNADGRSDLVVTNQADQQVGWYVRPEDPTTQWTGYLLADYSTASPVDIEVVDVDGNGQLDLVIGTESPGSLRWFTPLGGVKEIWQENNIGDFSSNVVGFEIGLIDPGERADIIVLFGGATPGDDRAEWLLNPEP